MPSEPIAGLNFAFKPGWSCTGSGSSLHPLVPTRHSPPSKLLTFILGRNYPVKRLLITYGIYNITADYNASRWTFCGLTHQTLAGSKRSVMTSMTKAWRSIYCLHIYVPRTSRQAGNNADRSCLCIMEVTLNRQAKWAAHFCDFMETGATQLRAGVGREQLHDGNGINIITCGRPCAICEQSFAKFRWYENVWHE
jgi:hypothetical protein